MVCGCVRFCLIYDMDFNHATEIQNYIVLRSPLDLEPDLIMNQRLLINDIHFKIDLYIFNPKYGCNSLRGFQVENYQERKRVKQIAKEKRVRV